MSRLESDLFNYKSKYEKDGILINKLGITDPKELEKAERMITGRKVSKLYIEPGKQTFDPQHYLSIHKYLFEDIYPFAGEIRSEVITKSFSFCLPQNIYNELKKTLEVANSRIKYIDSRDKLLVFIVELFSDLDFIHPFREGNGRTLREFIRQYIEYICKKNSLEPFYLDYKNVDRKRYINAVVKADVSLDYSELLDLFNEIMKVDEVQIKKL